MSAAFEKKGATEPESIDTQELYAQIEQLKVENEFPKKKFQETRGTAERASVVKAGVRKLSVRRQCELLTVNGSRMYYKPVGKKPENIKMMGIMDKHVTDHPTEGVKSLVLFGDKNKS